MTTPSPWARTSRRFRTRDGLTLVGDLYGVETTHHILLLHGGGQSRNAWRATAEILAADGFGAWTLDLRGHGDSDWAALGDYSFDAYVSDLVTVLETLGGRCILVGASLGGLAAMMTAVHYPERVSGLALADITPWVNEERAAEVRDALGGSASGFATVEEAAAVLNVLRETPHAANPIRLRPHLREDEKGRLYWRWDPRVIVDRREQLRADQGQLAKAADRLHIPTLLMRAELSTLVSHDNVARFRQSVPALEYREVLGIGHMITGDENNAYATPILDFARRVFASCG